ncbi:MAG TPA: GntR family transcriptional regulator [Thermomicrobiales bacterium]|jgi:DNA-binding GntR family transcriptional regulator|nr:GntR family transcriptional regulator [Thermomicrobiales bacterium]
MTTLGQLQTEAAYQAIKRGIITCAIPPGQQVTEEQLAERFGTGRGAVRTALKRLYQEQLVQTISRQRYVIPPITLREARELFEVRMLLEPVAARRAADLIAASDIARLRTLSESHYDRGDVSSSAKFLAANTEFHVTIGRASGNVLLADLISNLLDRVERINHLTHALVDRNVDARDEHLALVQALEDRDGAQAERVMGTQIDATYRFVLEALTHSPSIQSASVAAPPLLIASADGTTRPEEGALDNQANNND